MNTAEILGLGRPELSHISRSLYIFCLRPEALGGRRAFDLTELAAALCSTSRFFPTAATPEVVKLCLTELEEQGFISRAVPGAPWGRCELAFPLLESGGGELPAPPFRMHKDWRVSAGFRDAALAAGLKESAFTERELAEFKGYWSGRAEKRNQAAWERAFAARLARRRSAGSFRAPGPRAQTPELKSEETPFKSSRTPGNPGF